MIDTKRSEDLAGQAGEAAWYQLFAFTGRAADGPDSHRRSIQARSMGRALVERIIGPSRPVRGRILEMVRIGIVKS